jgi:hypothetical protein
MKNTLIIALILICVTNLYAQDDLLDLLDEEAQDVSYVVEATFKGTRLINGHSIETRKKKNLDFIISHRFGKISDGAYEFYGLDQSNIRLGFDYGLTDRFNIGIGRNSYEKTYDGYLKYRLLQQTSGSGGMPLSVTLLSAMSVKTLKDPVYDDVITFSDKLAYSTNILIARKFNSGLSLQLMPSYVHFNAVKPEIERNSIVALGAGGRIKLSKRISLNAEYHYQFQKLSDTYYNSVAIGFDIETGGHVFQLHVTNSQAMIDKGFIAETRDDFFAGEIHLGFNISRTFQLGK